ncbi:MAG: nuclear transport factor 2 family protein [Ilumatobacter fluminis]|uniref:nuclear transport factor 2 family protein n=1 Tax=Ilumatobacter fluminis TaxID=467091 RepID=UPI0032ED640C
MSDRDPIFDCLDRWFEHLNGDLEGGLDSILHPDVVFLSPIVYTPQEGREITKMYLRAAGSTLADVDAEADTGTTPSAMDDDNKFSYVKVIREGHHAMLEFETTVDGKYANGVDIITCNDDGQIVEFKVMMRPLQAINAVHAEMKATLEKLAGG